MMNEASHSFDPVVKQRLGNLYDLVTGDEEARFCKDIPRESCHEKSLQLDAVD